MHVPVGLLGASNVNSNLVFFQADRRKNLGPAVKQETDWECLPGMLQAAPPSVAFPQEIETKMYQGCQRKKLGVIMIISHASVQWPPQPANSTFGLRGNMGRTKGLVRRSKEMRKKIIQKTHYTGSTPNTLHYITSTLLGGPLGHPKIWQVGSTPQILTGFREASFKHL